MRRGSLQVNDVRCDHKSNPKVGGSWMPISKHFSFVILNKVCPKTFWIVPSTYHLLILNKFCPEMKQTKRSGLFLGNKLTVRLMFRCCLLQHAQCNQGEGLVKYLRKCSPRTCVSALRPPLSKKPPPSKF